MFFAFFYVLYKRTRRSLRSFTFFIKERGILCVLFIRLKKNLTSFFQYIFIYIYLYISIYIYLYISIYIYWKKEPNVLRSFAKERNVLAFFSIFCKRTKCSLRSFTFFAKEQNVLCVLFHSKEKNGKERIVLLGFISHQKLKKERKRTLRSLKERKRTECSEQKRMRCPTLHAPDLVRLFL